MELGGISLDDDLGEIMHESHRFIVIRRASNDIVVLARRTDSRGTVHLVTASDDEHDAALREMREQGGSADNE
jgi:hypothetical protein